jgi:lipopolysaccharide export system permease protein
MRLIDRHIRRYILESILFVLVVLLAVETLVEFIAQLNEIGLGRYTPLKAFWYVPMRLPADIYQLFPMAGLIGSLIGLGRLAQTSELMIMRASGLSVGAITRSVVRAVLGLILLVTLIGEWVSPALQDYSDRLKNKWLGRETQLPSAGLWIKQGAQYLHIEGGHGAGRTGPVAVFDFDDNEALHAMGQAAQGRLDAAGRLGLIDVRTTKLGAQTTRVAVQKLVELPVQVQASLLKPYEKKIAYQSAWGLYAQVRYRHALGLNVSQYAYAFWKRLFQPLSSVLLICLGLPFIFGSLRTRSMGERMIVGVLVGFLFYMLNQFFGPISLIYSWPPALAAGAPTFLFLLLYLILLRNSAR